MKIAVLICGLIFDAQKAFMKGIERKIRDSKDVCSVFCCHGNDASNNGYLNGEYNIFDLPDFSEFDGVIYVKNTFNNNVIEEQLAKKIRESGVNCVAIDDYDENYVNITSDEGGSIYELVDHMVKEHGCKKFYFVMGYMIGTDTQQRTEGFMRALADNNLDFEDHWAYHGNYEYRSGISAADYFLSLNEPMADCIICCNDQMAVGVIMELKKNGIKVPKDVKVTGVDYDFVSRVITPSLTTVKRQQYQKGLRAVDILHNYEDYKIGQDIKLNILLNIGETCGCHIKDVNHNDVVDALAVDRYEQTELNQMVKMMTADFMARQDYATLIDDMCRYAYRLKPKELYLNLNVKPETEFDYSNFSEKLLSDEDDTEYTEQVRNVISCVDGEPLESGALFNKKELYPPISHGGRQGVTYYFFPIHYSRRNFGYAIIGESGDLVRNEFFPNWANICSNAFENIRKSSLMNRMIQTLDKMWIYDTLTGIYNRAGFFKMSEPIVKNCIESNKKICVVFLDVDGLKDVNDTYGHDEGDNLIKEMAGIMKGVKKHGEIIMRYGGDEFVLLTDLYDAQKAEECIKEIERDMVAINEAGKHPFSLEASIGYYITELKTENDLNSIIEEADREMYKKKYVKKALKRKH